MKNDTAYEWIEIGNKDFEAAKYLCNMNPIPKEIICYHCEQAAEKYLKGFIAFNEGEVTKTHDLLILNKMCLRYDKGFTEIVNHCLELTDYSVSIRYPYHIEISEEDVNLALESTRYIIDFINNKLKIH